jgi:hypothetical protein
MAKALPPSDNPSDEDIEIVAIPDEFGAVVIGTGHELDEFAQRWEHADRDGGVVTLWI